MAMPGNVLKVTLKGSIATDVWNSASYWSPTSTPPTLPIPSAFGTAVANAAYTYFAALAPYTSAMVGFSGVRLDWYGSTGSHDASLDATPTSGSASGSAAGNHPPQTAVVASLRSALPGPKGRGRMYLPLLSGTVNTSTGAFPSADATSIATATKNYLAAVSALTSWGGGTWFPVVASRTGTPSTHAVTAVKVGNVFDTQRRRRNKVIEVYSTVTYP